MTARSQLNLACVSFEQSDCAFYLSTGIKYSGIMRNERFIVQICILSMAIVKVATVQVLADANPIETVRIWS